MIYIIMRYYIYLLLSKQLVVAFMHTNRTLEKLTSRLMIEESRLSTCDQEVEGSAFAAKQNQRMFHQKGTKRDQNDKTGHWERDCPSRKTKDDSEQKHDAFVSEVVFSTFERN